MLTPVGSGLPDGVRAALRSLQDGLLTLLQPAAPTPVFAVAQTGLPPPAEHPHTVVLVTDLNILAHSDGSHWIRQDTGAVIV